MTASAHVTVGIDLRRIRQNVNAIRSKVGVAVLSVIKADAYGFGAREVAAAIAGTTDGFCIFSLEESIAIDLHALTDKPVICLGPPSTDDADAYLRRGVRPAVTTVEQARALRPARPIICVDTGM